MKDMVFGELKDTVFVAHKAGDWLSGEPSILMREIEVPEQAYLNALFKARRGPELDSLVDAEIKRLAETGKL